MWATTIEGQNDLAPLMCLRTCKFHVTDSQNTLDQITSDHIAFCAFHSFLKEIQTNARYIIHAAHA